MEVNCRAEAENIEWEMREIVRWRRFVFDDTTTTEMYTEKMVGSVR